MSPLRILLGLLKGLFLQSPRLLRFAESFLQSWNAHDAPAVLARVGAGDYRDPLSRGALSGAALESHARALFTAFPDLRFVLTGPVTIGPDSIAARYRLEGTHTGPLPGGLGIEAVAATGRRLSLDATLFVTFDDDGTPCVNNHFDTESLADQLGFYALLMPREQGHYQFGAFYRLNKGNVAPPEAIGITWLQVRGGDGPFDTAARVTNQVLESFSDRPGFITGIIGARPPDRDGNSSGFTLSAWENIEALEANLLPNEDHQRVVHQFMKEGLAYGTHSRVYSLVRAKPMMIACTACGKKNNAHKTKPQCSACGAALEAAPAYW
ncbi:ester cyclase [Flagellatimonas centrodinii]|uniref:ester cyclase n=1 Tax=Flagellatimonas centrodinii TaxID=2806210 RepID=UPI001FF90262|nr:ester cyclase [Flagellatimonas centrodinii]ULQ46420.1 ester cyclase [Flagellatimonas centrodinii]